MILTNLILHYVNQLPCEFGVFWCIVSCEEFSYTNTCKNCFPYCGSTPGEGMPSRNLIPHLILDFSGALVLEKKSILKDFPLYTPAKIVSPIVASADPQGSLF
jgi:hypothetical protein